MPNIVMEGYYSAPKYSLPSFKHEPPKPKTWQQQPTNTGWYDYERRQAEQRAQAQAQAARAAELNRIAAAQALALQQRRQQQATQSRTSLTNFWNKTKTSIVPDIGNAFQIAGNAFVNPNYKVPTNAWQTYTPPTSGGGFNEGGYREESSDAFGSINPKYGFPGYAEDWGMATAGQFGSGMLDIGNWGKGVPSWEEVLAKATPWTSNQYDIAGSPYWQPEPQEYIPSGYNGYGGGGYGGGSYSSKPGYYGQSSNYGNKWYENLLQWNI